MNNTIIGPDQTEEDEILIITYKISDEALETAAGTEKEKASNYTLGVCTGLAVCPG